ncbi:MAG: LysM peptidoglycan-binding domain-containing protein [bacterium]|nr:LysM peptidoglycan-binding domain-containing protein [bacterium]
MREQKRLYEMNDRELRSYKRALKARRQRRRKIAAVSLITFATLCFIVIFAVSHNAISSKAGSGFKYYTRITVAAGDTLWDIADDYMDENAYRNRDSYIAEVRSINHLDEDEPIIAGQTLIVPYYLQEYIY